MIPIGIASDTSDAYLTGLHEAMHSIDAEKSSHMEGFSSTLGNEGYTLHSSTALKAAMKSLGVRSNSRKYDDMVFMVAGSLYEYEYMRKKPWGIVALAIEREEAGKTTELSSAIAKEFAKW